MCTYTLIQALKGYISLQGGIYCSLQFNLWLSETNLCTPARALRADAHQDKLPVHMILHMAIPIDLMLTCITDF